ncbi:UvrD-helicase domain-containing protein [Tepidibacillus marianensis]|uniref:UvrD-helicase domain-containing protein n=1 Tax=Tepidibacillus marianensis TaxID=3131995 RepID=UPI0030D1C356
MVARAGYLIMVEKIHPEKLLLMTFTRKAAEEMKSRIAQLDKWGKFMSHKITAGTFHSIFLRILRSQGYTQQILSNEKYKHTIVKIFLKEMKLQDNYQPETLLSILSSQKAKMIEIGNLPEGTAVEKEMKEIFTRYEEWKRRNNFIDFDDILLETYKLLRECGSLLGSLQKRFQYIMVDEAQDMNKIQYELIGKKKMKY